MKIRLLLILIILVSIYKTESIEILANYKLWKSVSSQLVYDFSGSSRHSRLFSNVIITDRGISQPTYSLLRLMHYGFLSLNEYTISFWLLNLVQPCDMRLLIYRGSHRYEIKYIYNPASTYTTLEFRNKGTVFIDKTTNIPTIQGWNFHTINISINTSNPGRFNINLYLNLAPLHSTFIDLAPTGGVWMIDFYMYDSSTATGIICNEIWVHTGFSAIFDLNYLITESSSCACVYTCPTTSNRTCLQVLGERYNKYGQLCDGSCTNSSLSCESVPTNCIVKNKPGCQYGLYDRESLECIFYCPNNSCICPTLPTSGYGNNPINSLLSCSCIIGYKNTLNDTTACISIHCLTYHKEVYKYVCDTAESGYALYNVGECCECISGFTQVQAYPIICVNTSICIGHTISGGDYLCSSCAEGYTIDSQGKCNLCNINFTSVLANPYTCIPKIDNCSDFIYIETGWKCKTCIEGYFLYDISTTTSGCALFIYNCSDYQLEGFNLVCESCISGFKLNESKTKCLPINCLVYNIEDERYACSECSLGYLLDLDGKCNICETDYDNVSNDPFRCIPKIDNCTSYMKVEEDYLCKECSLGYMLGSSGLCDECDVSFVKVESGSSLCEPYIPSCIDYDISEEVLRCRNCAEGYTLDINYECTQCIAGYVNLPQDSSICIRETSNCQEYGLLQNTWICLKCKEGYDIEDFIYSSNSVIKCTTKPSTTDQEPGTNDSSNKEEEETISEAQIQRGESVASSNNISATITMGSTVAGSMICMDPNVLILYINTIQILSLLQYLKIDLPFEIRKQQSSTNKYIKRINLLSNIKIEGKDLHESIISFMNDEDSFLGKSVYQFIMLGAILISNSLLYFMSRYGRGNIKQLASKVIKYFKYTVYIQLYMITYLDISQNAISKFIQVRSI